jgi:DNA primase
LGRYCGFGGRVYKPDDTRSKYYNSRENANFEKGSLLFGLDAAKKSIKESDTVFLVEGYTDCIAMVQHGYPQAVATLGTACTLEHLKHLSRYASKVYVVYDGDKAGQQAMLRLAELCWQCSMDMYTITLPANDDPASLLVEGKSLAPYVASAQDIFSYFLTSLGENFNQKPLQEKLRISERIIEILSHIDTPLKQDLLIQKASQIFGLPVDSIKREIAEKFRVHRPVYNHEKVVQKPEIFPAVQGTLPEPPELEKRIFFAIMNNIQLVNGAREDYLIRYFSEPLRMLLMKVKQEKEANATLTFDQFFGMLEPENQRIVSKIIMQSREQVSHETFECLVQQFQKYHWKKMAHDIAVKLEVAKRNQSDEVVQKLIQEFLELKKRVLEKNIL